MTREEATMWLIQIKSYIIGGDEEWDSCRHEAIDLAIEALSEPSDSDIIRRSDAVKAIMEICEKVEVACIDCTFFYDGCLAEKQINALPTADRQDRERFYIKIYADDEPCTKAEKLYQISNSDNQEIAEWLKEYFPTADRPHGEWKYDKDGIPRCSNCNKRTPYATDFCPNCGARMEAEHE